MAYTGQEAEKITVDAYTPDLKRSARIILSVGNAKRRCDLSVLSNGHFICTSNRVSKGAACNLTTQSCWEGSPVIMDLKPENSTPR